MEGIGGCPQDSGHRGGLKLGWKPLILIGSGIGALFIAALLESHHVEAQPWATGIFVPEGEPQDDSALPVWSRRIPSVNFESVADWLERAYPDWVRDPETQELIARMRAREKETERVILVPLSPEDLEALLATGRAPQPGKPEVLAGPLVRTDTFVMDGITFEVTGRISSYAGLFLNACLLPDHESFRPLWSIGQGATRGWLLRDGAETIEKRWQPQETEEGIVVETQTKQPEIMGGLGLTSPALCGIGIAGLGLAACGGALAATRLLRRWGQHAHPLLTPLLAEIAWRPRLWLGLHVLFYGTFLVSMAAALRYPAWNMALTQFIAQIFTEGELSFIGQAYASEDIARAALATFYHNYVTATLLFTLAVSLIVPGAGVLKTWISLGFMGFAMSPLWTGTLSAYTYHSITMIMEFEAYILASFAAAVYALRLGSGVFLGQARQQFTGGIRVVLGAAILSGGILAAAALYEAVTLLTFK